MPLSASASSQEDPELNNSMAGNNSQNFADSNTLQFGPMLFDRSHLLDPPFENHDYLVTFNGRQFPVHKSILAPVSFYFEQLLCGEWAESTQKEFNVTVPDASAEDVEWVLRALYGAQQNSLEKAQVEGVLNVACYFQLRQLLARVQDVVSEHVRSVPEVLGLGITDPVILDRISETVDFSNGDLQELLRRATRVGAAKLQGKIGMVLADSLLRVDAPIGTLTDIPFAGLVGCFSAEMMTGLPNEDAVLRLLRSVCETMELSEDAERELAACIRLQHLSVQGIEEAFSWPAIDRSSMIIALAKQRDPTAFSNAGLLPARRFNVAFSTELSKGALSYFDKGTVVVHTSSKTRAVAVVDAACDLGKFVAVTFTLVHDKKDDEGTCFGVVSRQDVGTVDYRDAVGPLWRAYNGEIREGRSVKWEADQLHPQDTAALLIDGISRRVEFRKNGKRLCVRDSIPETCFPLCPAVWFYGSGERVLVQNSAGLWRGDIESALLDSAPILGSRP